MSTLDTSNTNETLMGEIVDATKICNGLLPDTHQEFWRELAVYVNKSPLGNSADNARLVLETLGVSWEEDFIEEDGETPALGALEAIHGKITKTIPTGAGLNFGDDEPEEEEDDSGITALGDINVQVQNMNIGTVLDWINIGRLTLNPEWQRSFVWPLRKQQALIESILLKLPLPSFLLFTDKENKLFVIDGRQRLETLSRFTSPKPARGEARRRFKTYTSRQVNWKDGDYLNPVANKYYGDFPERFHNLFAQQSLQIAILNMPSDQLYEIFKRYNTGAVALNAAEIRNAVYQDSDLHKLMFRLGGEHRSLKGYKDEQEKTVGEDLRGIMGNKSRRYGAYAFIGRVFAFKYEETGSVATATNAFMSHRSSQSYQDLEPLRQEFMAAFKATVDWYEYPLIEPKDGGRFHAWLATIQMVASYHCLNLIRSGEVSEDLIRTFIRENWEGFAINEVLEEKQNSTSFWKFQKLWIEKIQKFIESRNATPNVS